jgi:hypothetical protein
MGWHVGGSRRDLSFQVDQFGLSISGEGEQRYPSSLFDTREINGQPARWTIRRASDASEAAGLLGLDVRDMKRYLDPAVVKLTSKPIVIIKYERSHISFCVFLPDHRFSDTLQMSKLILADDAMQYGLGFDFVGFLPRKNAEFPEMIGYDDWLAGHPCIIIDSFTFGLRRIQPSEKLA